MTATNQTVSSANSTSANQTTPASTSAAITNAKNAVTQTISAGGITATTGVNKTTVIVSYTSNQTTPVHRNKCNNNKSNLIKY